MLNDLATEQVAFLSTRRCRHLLAEILPQLLCAIGRDARVPTGRSTIWRASATRSAAKACCGICFAVSPPSLELYVKLCAASPYLSDILTTNPGMIDELVDSLQLDKLPTRAESATATLAELCRGASDTLPILHDFKNAEHLRIGVRDILGKEDIDRTHAALADVAETCLAHVAELEYDRLVEKFGVPTIGPGPFEGEPCRLVIVGLGKLGGREPNYHSHLDVLFLYEGRRHDAARQAHSRQQRADGEQSFFHAARPADHQAASPAHAEGPAVYGRCTAAADRRRRRAGFALRRYSSSIFSGAAPLWQWQALCQARPVFGDTVGQGAASRFDSATACRAAEIAKDDLAEIRRSRLQLERGASPTILKRGPGGTLDVEFIVQMLQLQHAAAKPDVLTTNTQSATCRTGNGRRARAGGAAEKLGDSYRFLRRVESGLRLLDTSARHDLPEAKAELRAAGVALGPQQSRTDCGSNV